MPAIKPEQQWGKHEYLGGAPVPLVTERCTSVKDPHSKAHVCKQHTGHDGEHRCVCSKAWPANA